MADMEKRRDTVWSFGFSIMMQTHRVFLRALVFVSLVFNLYAQSGSASKSSAGSDATKAFLGRWDLTLKAPDREYPSWIEISEENGQLRRAWSAAGDTPGPFPKSPKRTAVLNLFRHRKKKIGRTTWSLKAP